MSRAEILRLVLGATVSVSVLLWRRRRYAPAAAVVGCLGLALIGAKPLVIPNGFHPDMDIFWRAGRRVLAGEDPYRELILNTPNILVLLALLARLSLPVLVQLWTWATIASTLALVPLSARYYARADKRPTGLTWGQLAALSILVLFSTGSVNSIAVGQMHGLSAVALVGALVLMESNRPLLSGVSLGLSLVKIHTAAPVFPVFLKHRSGLKILVTAALFVVVEILVIARPADVRVLFAAWTRNIAMLSGPGAGNDYSFEGNYCAGIIGLNHLIYRLGVTDRTVVAALHWSLTGALGVWLCYQLWKRRYSGSSAAAVFVTYAMLFLYHRHYDTIVLAVPLTYAVSRYCRVASGPEPVRDHGRYKDVTVALIIPAILNAPAYSLNLLNTHHADHGRLTHVVVGAMNTWLLLVVLFLLHDRAAADQPGPTAPS